MARCLAFVSGKGGVGKTTIVANLGIALSSMGLRTLIIDTDVAMSNLSLIFKLQHSPITLHEVLAGEATIQDAIYAGPKGVEIVPSVIRIDTYKKADPARLKPAIAAVKDAYDFILLDAPAGISRFALASMYAATETVLVLAPDPASFASSIMAKFAAQRVSSKPTGFVLNMVRNEKGELSREEISRGLEMPCYGMIPYDPEVRRTLLESLQPIIVRKPKAKASRAFIELAERLSGRKASLAETGTVSAQKEEKKESFLSRILRIFKRKKE